MPEYLYVRWMRLQMIRVKASDLYYKYMRNTAARHQPKFAGKPDREPFDRDDLYEVLPMLSAVMHELGVDDQRTLHRMEELLILNMPRFITIREDVFDFLVNCMRETMAE